MVKIEKDRIEFCKLNQKQYRVVTYNGVYDHLQKRIAGSPNTRLGKVTILPADFRNSPRYILQRYHDSIAISQKYGKPDLFITMTCNPNWEEIKECSLPEQQPSDRPDLIVRVFELKKKHLIYLISKKHFVGNCIAYMYLLLNFKNVVYRIYTY